MKLQNKRQGATFTVLDCDACVIQSTTEIKYLCKFGHSISKFNESLHKNYRIIKIAKTKQSLVEFAFAPSF